MRTFRRKLFACLTILSFVSQWPASFVRPSTASAAPNVEPRRFVTNPAISRPQHVEAVRPVLPPPGVRVVGPTMLSRPLALHVVAHDALAVQALNAARSAIQHSIGGQGATPFINLHPLATPTPMFPGIIPITRTPTPMESPSSSQSRFPKVIRTSQVVPHMGRLITGTNYYLTVQADKPVAYYRLDDTNSTLRDYGPNNLNGVYGSSVTENVSGLLTTDSDTAASFPNNVQGSSGVATVARNSALEPSSAVSLEMWVSFPAMNYGGCVVCYGPAGSGSSYPPYSFYQTTNGGPNNTGQLTWGIRNGTSETMLLSNTKMTANTTYHWVGAYDGSTAKVYVNGVLDNSLSGLSGSLGNYGTYGLGIGGSYQGNVRQWAGKIDEIAIYNYALNAAQIAHHYQAGSGVAPSPVPTPLPTPNGGIEHWWTYESESIGGVGDAKVNVANGNLLVDAIDMKIPNKGTDFNFDRVYNSLSLHDYAGSDGSTPSNYGNGWTNSFDAHLAYYGQLGILSVFDVDGSRYDYTSNGSGCWTPPTGQHSTLCSDGANGYFWTKLNGKYYYFYSPVQTSANAGFAGRIYEICGRNHNNYLAFHGSGNACFTSAPPSSAGYYFDSGATSHTNLNKIVAGAEDGRTSTLLFGSGPGGQRLLASLAWPDGTTVSYSYDTLADLTEVDEPSNNTGGTLPKQQYAWIATHLLQYVYSPRWLSTSNDGPYYKFTYNTSGTVKQIDNFGDVNPQIGDYTLTYLQPSLTHDFGKTTPYRSLFFSYSGPPNGSTSLTDTDGHSTTYLWDQFGRVTQTSWQTGDPQADPQTLTTSVGWDANNNQVSSTDFRGNETDLAYDGEGNIWAIGFPSTVTSQGTLRPTILFAHDQFNNVTAHCDANWTAANPSALWTSGPPASNVCTPTAAGATAYTWSATSDEPFEELTQIIVANQTSLQYKTTFQYPSIGVDYGLPITITGDSFNEYDQTNNLTQQVTPQETYAYDSSGNVLCYSNGTGTWAEQYNLAGQPTAIDDPDDALRSGCATIPVGSTFVTTNSYFPNGQLKLTATPIQVALNMGTLYSYDLDGNVSTVDHHYDNARGTTINTYDGADRLVEVALPLDQRKLGDGYPIDDTTQILERYIYDISSNHQVTFGASAPFYAHGQMYKVQENVLAGAPWFADLKGNAFDLLGRPVSKFYYNPDEVYYPPTVPANQQDNYYYDKDSTSYGLLSYSIDDLAEKTTYKYDTREQISSICFPVCPGGTFPGRQYIYDANGEITTINSDTLGSQQFSYDSLGRMTQSIEPPGMTSPATLNYSYYPNGWKKRLGVVSTALTKPDLFSYSYAVDGLRTRLNVHYTTTIDPFTWSYTAGGRVKNDSDPSLPSGAHVYSYSSYGQLATKSFPGIGNATYTFDVEHEPKSAGNATGARSYSYSTRGQLLFGQNLGLAHPNHDDWCYSTYYQGPPPSYTLQCGPDNSLTAQLGSNSANTFDARGRIVSGVRGFYNGGKGGTHFNGNFTRSFDFEDHLVSQVDTNFGILTYEAYCQHYVGPFNETRTYTWGPNGHPSRIQSPAATPPFNDRTLHWDDDTLLFTTNANGQMDDLKVEFLGDYTPLDGSWTGLTLWDRDGSGSLVGWHNASGATTSYFPPSGGSTDVGFKPGCTNVSNFTFPHSFGLQNGYLFSPRVDGFSDGILATQGSRAIDMDNTIGSWISQERAPGDSGDPTSLKPYIWNGNNGLSFMDPTGFKKKKNNPDEAAPDVTLLGVVTTIAERPVKPDYQSAQMFSADYKFAGAVFAGILWLTPGEAEYKEAKVGITVLGRSKDGYVKLASLLHANVLNIPKDIWNALSADEKWAANQKFLDEAIARGDQFILSTHFLNAEPGTFFAKEIKYLLEKGYIPTNGGFKLVRGLH